MFRDTVLFIDALCGRKKTIKRPSVDVLGWLVEEFAPSPEGSIYGSQRVRYRLTGTETNQTSLHLQEIETRKSRRAWRVPQGGDRIFSVVHTRVGELLGGLPIL